MARYPEDVYNPVPNVVPQTSVPSDYLTIRANPAETGGLVAGALTQAGKTLEAGDQQLVNVALQYQGMLNESKAVDLQTEAMKQRGEILSEYRNSEGFDALNQRDAVVAKLAAVRQNLLKSLNNPAVARAFNMLDSRSEGYAINDADSWANQQGHTAAKNSAASAINLAIDQASDPSVANNDVRIGSNIGDIKFHVAHFMQLQGYGQWMSQDKQGNISFDTSKAEGQQAQSVYQDTLNKALGKAYLNVLGVKMRDNTVTAMQWWQSNKNKIPNAYWDEGMSKLQLPFRSEQARQTTENILSQSQAEFYNQSQAPGTDTTKAPQWMHTGVWNQESRGALLTKDGQQILGPMTKYGQAIGPMQIMSSTLSQPGFGVKPAQITPNMTPAQKAAEYKREGDDYLDAMYHRYHGNPVEALAAYNWNYKSVDNWVANGSNFAELPAETRDYISKILYRNGGSQGKGFQTQADFYGLHAPEIIEQAREQAEIDHPGDASYADTVAGHMEQRINQVVYAQNQQNHADINSLYKYINDPNNNINSITQLWNAPEEVKDAFERQLVNNPLGMQSLENNFMKAKSRGSALTYGTDFWPHLQDVLSGKVDNINILTNYVGSDKNAPLTNTGHTLLNQFINDRSNPQNVPFQRAELNFLSEMHGEATGSNIHKGFSSPLLEQRFTHQLQTILPLIEAERTSGKTANDLFNKNSKNYLGNKFELPKPAEITAEWGKQLFGNLRIPDTKGTELLFKQLNDPTQNRQQKQDALTNAYGAGAITREQAIDLSLQYGVAQHKAAQQQQAPTVPSPEAGQY